MIMTKYCSQANFPSLEDWKIQLHNATANATDVWSCVKGFQMTYIIIAVLVLLSCCCTIYLRNKLVNLWKIVTCYKWRKKKSGKSYDRDVERGKYFWKKSKNTNSPRYAKVEQCEKKQESASLGIQNNVAAPRLSIDSPSTGCYKCYKKKRNKRRKR